jgi:hypothetical protein
VQIEGYAEVYTRRLDAEIPGDAQVDRADIVLKVKAYSQTIRSRLLVGIEDIVKGEA